jgi:hypothetical protein|tara:strand:- start:358 stop:1329 length:972 start_codon:yes stop_codon:yes gene_type:complete
MDNKYIQRFPIEIILNSNDGVIFDDLDGHKIFNLPAEINARSDEILLLFLKKAFIPFSFYLLSNSQKNNKLDIRETQSDGNTNIYSITIPNANYNITQLISKIKTLLEETSTFSYKYSISFDKTTGKVRFLLLSGSSALKSEILFQSGTNSSTSCRRLLGYKELDIEFTLSVESDSQNVVDMADGLDSIRIGSNLVGDNIKTSNGETGELLILPVNFSPFSILYFDAIDPFHHKLATRSIREIEIKMTDSNDNVIDFNNIPYTLILEVEFQHNPLGTITNQNVKIDTIKSAEIRKNLFNDIMNRMNAENQEEENQEEENNEKK